MSRVSNRVRFMGEHYGGRAGGTIAALALCFAVFLAGQARAAGPVLCVLVPHFKDEYWLSVAYGLEQEAAREGADLLFFEAGGYRALTAQIAQLEACAERDVDAILIGAVASDDPELATAIERAARSAPVFGLVNALDAPALSGRVGVDWRDMGRAIGDHLARRHPAGSDPRTAIYISGPAEAGWTGPLEAGLRAGLAGSAVSIAEVFGADTGLRQQLALVETALDRYPETDYLIGSAPAIEAAMGYFANTERADPPVLVSTYFGHSILRGLLGGRVRAAVFDDPVEQGILAIRMALNGTTTAQRTGPEITVLTPRSPALADVRLSPAEYFPSVR
ncbi:TMAO reductase system periplasmic protein TorT [Marivita sp. GX14005]|uniref:TMAO reductase system periplasmic protein TorT n=1 Tax=Marivita sp. GX14005 TaxID=2942276 RepID=UPI0020185F28|nr:TMAO reductase system periplasmic protein TorT [Marivita sp. GX14005]MCL3882562.1 TMAO reductase system periplasmic protein TorT [Marivita sp. GX14005]